MSTDGWRLKKRSRDPEAAEVAWQKWKHDRPDHSRGTRGMTKTTAEAHLFSVRMRTIRDNLEKEFTNSSDAGKLQHACDELRNLFLNNKDFLLETSYEDGKNRANRLRFNGALVNVVLQRFDELKEVFDSVYERGNVTTAQMNSLQIQMGLLRDALPPTTFSRSSPRPQHNERDALEQLTNFNCLPRVDSTN